MEKRIGVLCEKMAEQGLEAALVTLPANQFYLTGVRFSDGYLLVTKDRAVVFVDGRYLEAVSRANEGFEVVLLRDFPEDLSKVLSQSGVKKLSVESGFVTLSQARIFEKICELCWVSLDKTSVLLEILEKMRTVKMVEEIKKIKSAQIIAEKAFFQVLPLLKPGVTERDIALELDFCMRRLGAEGPAFETIVLFGTNTSMPHGVPGKNPLKVRDIVLIDMGAVYQGYCSDMTRTVFVGGATKEQQKVYETVLRAQELAIESICPGALCREIDAAARAEIERVFPGRFSHTLGHGVGLLIHELPRLGPKSRESLEPGMVVTVEPGVYLPGQFGVRIEDLLLVTGNGPENLCGVAKELTVL